MLLIDFEVFAYDWLCVALDLINKKKFVIVNDRDEFVKFYEAHKDDLWIGYNIRGYDSFIAKAIVCGFDPKEVNDWIIVKKQKGHEFSRMFRNVPLNFFDIQTTMQSLKTLEAFAGEDVRESSVDFTIDRKLTEEEIEEVIAYCTHDVEQTGMVLTLRQEELTSQLGLVKMFNLPMVDMGKTKGQLSAKILGAVFHEDRGDELDYVIPETLQVTKYRHIVDWFIETREKAKAEIAAGADREEVLERFYKQKLEVDVAGVPHVFAWGGLHGAIPNYIDSGEFINCDVNSYYPSLMIEYNYHSRSIKDPSKFVDIYNSRLAFKKAKDPRQSCLKIVLNSTYGCMGFKYSALFDPLMRNNVCVSGQLLLLDLVERLEKYVKIVQSNTDGVMFKLEKEDNREIAMKICEEWQKRTRMGLSFDSYARVIERDVNNYIIVDKNGKSKSKGIVKKLNPLDNDLPIVNKALVDYFVKGVPVRETVYGSDNLIDFQKVFKVSGLYMYAMHNGEPLREKTFRVFASKNESDTALFKVKNLEKNPEKFANCPDHCFIDNSSMSGRKVDDRLDREWYVALVNERIRQFEGEKKYDLFA